MSRLEWDKIGEKLYRAGVDRGVMYKMDDKGAYPKGEAWNGLTKVTESPSGAEATKIYANNAQYLAVRAAETFDFSLEAYMYPDGFAECDGSKEVSPGVYVTQQTRAKFGLTYRVKIGNDTQGVDHGYELHIIYGASASPSSKDHDTINETVDPSTMSWDCTTEPIQVKANDGELVPSAHIVINSLKCPAETMKKIEDVLYGSGSAEAKLPLPEELFQLLGGVSLAALSTSEGTKIPVPTIEKTSDSEKQATK